MPVKPVSPAEAMAFAPNIDSQVTKVNSALARPWTASDKMHGRWIAVVDWSTAIIEAVADVFRAEGWAVDYRSDRDGQALVFKPK